MQGRLVWDRLLNDACGCVYASMFERWHVHVGCGRDHYFVHVREHVDRCGLRKACGGNVS